MQSIVWDEITYLFLNVNGAWPLRSRPKRIPRSYPSLKNTPFSRILDEENTPFSTEIADFEAQ